MSLNTELLCILRFPQIGTNDYHVHVDDKQIFYFVGTDGPFTFLGDSSKHDVSYTYICDQTDCSIPVDYIPGTWKCQLIIHNQWKLVLVQERNLPPKLYIISALDFCTVQVHFNKWSTNAQATQIWFSTFCSHATIIILT